MTLSADNAIITLTADNVNIIVLSI